jgi:hypothetical protein
VPWSKVDEAASAPVVGEHRYRVPSTDGYHGHGTARRSTALTTWKCLGCGKSAVTDGCDPGRCLWRPCRYYGAGD